jgi:hypothetical protein
MKGIQIGNGAFLDFANTEFDCPHCGIKYNDADEKYLNRINKNKSGMTRIRCTDCNQLFGLVYDFKADLQSFELKNAKLFK